MHLHGKHVAIIGAGVAGLSAAGDLAEWGVDVSLFEKTPFLGGHAIQLGCKAAPDCVQCGACMAEDKLLKARSNKKVTVYTGVQIESVCPDDSIQLRYSLNSPLINAEKCNGCGICLQKCPVPGAILQGHSPRMGPYVAIRRDLCRFFDHAACTLCRDTCPQKAIALTAGSRSGAAHVDAILAATGFAPYNPSAKPYGYGRFQNVMTSLDVERRLRTQVVLTRPSDGKPVERMAFIHCVGSRDAALGHSWCSKICCGSALRMARLIRSRQPGVQITSFYMDVQTFGKDFNTFYPAVQEEIEMVRAIPGDILCSEDGDLQAVYFDAKERKSVEAIFDMIVLSVGLTPPPDNVGLAKILHWPLDSSGFMMSHRAAAASNPPGVFMAGAAIGPMSIAESISSSEQAVWDIVRYLGVNEPTRRPRGE